MAANGKLAGKIAVVTGAGRGIGEAIALRLAGLGMHVALAARSADQLERLCGEVEARGGQASVHPLDLRDPAAIERFGRAVHERFGACHALVNNAGAGGGGTPLHELDPAAWDEVMESNLKAPYLMIRALAPGMIERKTGHIVNISSLAGHNPVANAAAYSASKWGLNGLTYSVAEELRPHGIRVSVVAPGSVNTGFGGGAPGTDERALRKIQPGDVAHVVAMLLTQEPQSFVSEVLLRPTSKS